MYEHNHFSNAIKILAVLLIFFIANSISFGQLTGNKDVGGGNYDFYTIAGAIDTLNTQGVGSGGVTFKVFANHTETFSSPTDGMITATGTLNNQIVFQKSGIGNNPLITAGVGTGTLDGIIIIAGGDYITFDKIDVTESAGNTDATTRMEWGYALLKKNGSSPFDGCQYVTIKNCNITLNKAYTASIGIYTGNHTKLSNTALNISTATDAMNNCKFFGNVISNVYIGISLNGFADAAPYSLYDQNNEIGVDGGNGVTNYGGSNVAAYGIYAIYQNKIRVNNNTINGGSNTAATLYGIYTNTGTSSNVEISGNTVTINGGGTTQNIYAIRNAMGSTANGNTVTMSYNVVQNCTYTTATTGWFYGIYNGATAENVNIFNNTISSNSKSGSTTLSYLYCITSDALVVPNINIYSNVINNNQHNGATGRIYGISSAGTNASIYSNTVSNNSIASNSGTSTSYNYGYECNATNQNIYDNEVYNLSQAGSTTGNCYVYGISTSGSSVSGVKNIYNNLVKNLTVTNTSTGTGIIGGIMQNWGLSVDIYKNKIYNLTTTGSATTVSVYGISIGSIAGAGGWVRAYNNFISDLKAPTTNYADAVRGITMAANSNGNVGLYFNTIYLKATSSGTNFGTSGIYQTAYPLNGMLDMRNNILIDSSEAKGTGLVVAFRRSGTDLGNYSTISNYNDFYAGTPSATNLIYYDGTNSDQSLSAFQTRVYPREAQSFSEYPPFENVALTPSDLRIKTSVATQTESGGTPITSPIAITDDYEGTTRNSSYPDVGADEFAGTILDLIAPSITYTPLVNSSQSTRTLVVTVIDPSGVPTTNPGYPHLYYKKAWNGTFTAVTPSSNSGSDFTFQFGGDASVGDTVSYYVVARDGATTPNLAANPSIGTGGFSYDPPAASTPPTIPNSYIRTGLALSGPYEVGTAIFNKITGRNITFEKTIKKVKREVHIEVPLPEPKFERGQENLYSPNTASIYPNGYFKLMEVEEVTWIPMENGKPYTDELYIKKSENPQYNYSEGVEGVYATITAAIADLNLRGVSDAVTFLLTDANYNSETLPITINVTNLEKPTASNTVTIRPKENVTASISNAGASTQVFKILNSFVTIDGSNAGGTDRNLTILNTSGTTPQVILVGSSGTTPITNVTVKNCVVINGAQTSSAIVVSDGTVTGDPGYFNYITIQNNDIRKAYIGVYANGGSNGVTNGSNLNINSNILTSVEPNSIRNIGIYVQGVSTANVANNFISYMEGTIGEHDRGIMFSSGTINSTISGNTITNHNFTGTGTWEKVAIYLSYNATPANVNIIGNTAIGLSSAGNSNVCGVYIGGLISDINIEKNTFGNIINTNAAGYGASGIKIATTSTTANISMINNFIYDIAGYGFAGQGGGDNGCGIILSQPSAGFKIYNNSIHLSVNQTLVTGLPTPLLITSSITAANALDIRNNIFATTQTVGNNRYAFIRGGSTNNIFSYINNNIYYTTGPNLGLFNSVSRVDLTAWQVATGQDGNSVFGDPIFVSNSNLHIKTYVTSPAADAGVYLASVPTDIDGDARNNSPDIGADEFTYVGYKLNLTALIQGFYDGATMVSDTVIVELRNTTTPYGLVESNKMVLNTAGQGSANFTSPADATDYYIAAKHRNAVETWSKDPQQFTGGSLNYDFTTASNKAYSDGVNANLPMKQASDGKWCFWSGEVTNNYFVEYDDLLQVYNFYLLALEDPGYYPEDITGNEYVEYDDVLLVYNNYSAEIWSQNPLNEVLTARPIKVKEINNRINTQE